MIATAPGKLILTGEYAVLDGAPALVAAVDRRVVARRDPAAAPTSPILRELAAELARRHGAAHPSARAAREIVVDSSALYDGKTKLGLGSSAAVTVAAGALALAAAPRDGAPRVEPAPLLELARAVHARVQGRQGAPGSGADIAAAVHGGLIAFEAGQVTPRRWPTSLRLIPCFTGQAAHTPTLVAAVAAARTRAPASVDAALGAITEASRAACQACAEDAPDRAGPALLRALERAARATAALATATGVALVPPCVEALQAALAPLGGTAKTTGAGGGDVAIAVIPAAEDVTVAMRSIVESGCTPLSISLDAPGVDLQPDAR